MQADLASPELVKGTWDYIICHGVFSWIPPDAQDGVLAIMRDNLAPEGIAFVSYNVLPGWHMRSVVRDVMKFHTNEVVEPAHRVAQGRKFLGELAQIVTESTPYGQLLRQEAAELATMPDSYILGEFLSEVNAPIHFHEFVARARTAGLAHVVDLDMHAQRIQMASPEIAGALSQLGGGDPVLTEQYLDIFQGRQFRQSMLLKMPASENVRRMPEIDRDCSLFFGSRLRLSSEVRSDGAFVLRDTTGRSITTNDPMCAMALDFLGAQWPQNHSLRAMLSELKISDAAELDAVVGRLRSTLLQLVIAGIMTISTTPAKIGRGTDRYPKAWPLALAELRAGQEWLTNLLHAPVKLDTYGKTIVPMLDGTKGSAAIVERIFQERSNESEKTFAGWSKTRIFEAVQNSLQDIERLGLLVAE